MLHIINSANDPLITYIKDDPVRPEIPVEFRIGHNNEILALMDADQLQAMVCISYKDLVPEDCEQLFKKTEAPETAIFYTIWSYVPGAGSKLIFEAKSYIEKNKPYIKKFVTLSPKTEMARKFHLKNGASIFRENLTTVNFEYH